MTQSTWHAPPYVEPVGERRHLRVGEGLEYVNQVAVVVGILKALNSDEQRAILALTVGLGDLEKFKESVAVLREKHPALFWKNGQIARLTSYVAFSTAMYDETLGEADEQGFQPVHSEFLGFIRDPWQEASVPV